MESSSNDAAISKIENLEEPKIEAIPFSLISNPERKTSNLLYNSENHQNLKSRNGYFNFSFNESLFISSIEIGLKNFIDGSKFDYIWEGVDGIKHYGDATSSSDELYININGVVNSISF